MGALFPFSSEAFSRCDTVGSLSSPLRSCAEYVKHLKQVNKEKEEALEKAKKDLEEKQRKMEEDKRAQQDGPSDPESTTSSLTVSSGSERRKSGDEKASPESADDGAGKKRKAEDAGDDKGNKPEKKSRLRTHESSGSSSSDDGNPLAQQRVNVEQLVSVSDITDSNKDSSSDGNSSSGCQRPSGHHTLRNGSPNNAINAREFPAQLDDHSDVVITGQKRKVAPALESNENSSKSLKFELDYQEVFLKSNVPQILATTSGRIVAWNDFFLKATGLKAKEIDRLTIFSLVRPSKLSKLFEIVAAALRYGTLDSEISETEQGKESSTDETTAPSSDSRSEKLERSFVASRTGNYTAVTLPCTNFGPRRRPVGVGGEKGDAHFTVKPLYMTVTLMTDEDPRKRCFHCVLTDCPGTNGNLGRVTPELLSLMFH